MSQDGVYPPSEEFVGKANVSGIGAYKALYEKAKETPEEFWGELAEKEVFWFEKWKPRRLLTRCSWIYRSGIASERWCNLPAPISVCCRS